MMMTFNYRKTTGLFWNYYRDEPNSSYAGNNEKTKIFYPISNSKSLKYKTRLVGKLPDGKNELENIKIVVSLKYISGFISNLDIPLINAETELILKWN